jgi:hypothetical protein
MTGAWEGLQRICPGFTLCTRWVRLFAAVTVLTSCNTPAQEPLTLSGHGAGIKPWLLTTRLDPAESDSYHMSLNPVRSDEDAQQSFGPFDLTGPLFPDYSGPAMEADVADSLPPQRVHRLLPTNISFMEKAMWGEDGFMRTSGIVSPLTPEQRQSELGIRRTMLSLHQIGGFTSLGLMMATAYFGQRTIDDTRSRSLRNDHQMFVAATIVSYSVTGLLAIFSPPPLIRRDEVSTTTIHKTLAWVHAIGMIITPIIGSQIGRQRDSQKAHFHQLAGYITTATFAASMITVTF